MGRACPPPPTPNVNMSALVLVETEQQAENSPPLSVPREKPARQPQAQAVDPPRVQLGQHGCELLRPDGVCEPTTPTWSHKARVVTPALSPVVRVLEMHPCARLGMFM